MAEKEKVEKKLLQPAGDVAREIRKMANLYKALGQTADYLDIVGSLDNHISELEGRRDKLMADEQAAKTSVEVANEEARKAKQEAAGMVARLKGQAKKILDDANENATAIMSEAMTAQKKVFYDGTKKEKDELATVRKSAKNIRAIIKRLKDEESELSASIAAKREEYEAINEHLATLKKKVAVM